MIHYYLTTAPDGWYLVEAATGEIVDWFGDYALALETVRDQNEEL